MDNFCMMAARLLDWIDRTAVPPLPWVGTARGRVWNPPARHMEIIFAIKNDWNDLRIGDRPHAVRQGEVGIHSVHHGNYGEPPEEERIAWGLFLDLSKVTGFDDLQKTPFAAAVRVTEPDRLERAFACLQGRCTTLFGGNFGYPTGKMAYPANAGVILAKSSQMFVKAALLELMTCILQEGERAGKSAPALPETLAKGLEFISLHYADSDIYLDTIAAAADLSEDHFGRIFRRHIGCSPMQYLQEFRIEKSRFLLSNTDLFVEEVARSVGFRDQFYFSRLFQRKTGQSPTAFRAAARVR